MIFFFFFHKNVFWVLRITRVVFTMPQCGDSNDNPQYVFSWRNNITKTCLFKYTENFHIKILIFFKFLLKT